jgi:hypothetical protein
MSIKYTNMFHFKNLQNLPKLGWLVEKYAIWQPCLSVCLILRELRFTGKNNP